MYSRLGNASIARIMYDRYKDVLLPVATARFLQKHMDKVILDYKVDECLESSSKRYNSSARGIKIYIQDILGDKTHL